MEKKILDAMKKAGKPVRPGEVAKMIGEESNEVSNFTKNIYLIKGDNYGL